MPLDIFILLIAFQLKHFICDYPLQGKYMLGKFKETGWQLPLLAHTAVHAVGTFIIAVFYADIFIAAALAFFDMYTHFVIDRIKASPKLGGRFKPDQPYFWWALGADQMAHHLTHYVIIVLLLVL